MFLDIKSFFIEFICKEIIVVYFYLCNVLIDEVLYLLVNEIL